jgi:hypothetical protein
MSIANVRAALIDAVKTVLGVTPTEWENTKLDRPKDCARWARVHTVVNNPAAASAGSTGENRYTGFVQVTLHYRLGTGDSAARTDEAAFNTAFPMGLGLTNQGQKVTIDSCGSSAGSDESWYTQHITIYWYAYTTR